MSLKSERSVRINRQISTVFQVKSLKILQKNLTNSVSKACIKKNEFVGYRKEKKKDQKKCKKEKDSKTCQSQRE